ncbi:MAG: AAA family ATPase [Clostridiales bacterium]|nr:AAA family ATPase [Clostridiales bacterium]
MKHKSPKSIFLLLAVAALLIVWRYRTIVFSYSGLQTDEYFAALFPLADLCCQMSLVLISVVVLPFIVIAIGTPWGSWKIRDNLLRGGLYNHAGEAPILLSVDKPTNNGKRKKGSNSRMTVYEFDAVGIPLTVLSEKRDVIETALGIIIDQIKYGNGRKTILVSGVPAECDLPSVLPWNENYLSHEDFVLVLGESLSGPVTVNLANIPHILLGGSTGSGKSVLLKLLLKQCLRKDAEVYIADFKKGVDYPPVWHQKCRMCFTEADLLRVLEELVEELERRASCLVQAGCANLSEYNEKTGNNLHRHILACDEVAELLDKNGRSKEEKELLAKISSLLATLARQGRAFGIHLLLATQRPDSMVIPGQIKNNLDFRACGRADNVLSQIVLDNTSAADQIPKDARGRFITGDGTVFQAYIFDERKL